MGRFSLINSGSRAGAVLLFLATAVQGLDARQIETTLLPPAPRVGEVATLQVKIAGASSAEPAGIPSVDGLEIAYSGTRRSFEYINGKTWSGVVLSFAVAPARPGSFTIPPMDLNIDGETARTGELRFVAAGAAVKPGGKPVTGTAGVLAMMVPSSHRAYLGQPILIRYFLLYRGVDISGKPLFKAMPATKGFVLRQVDESIKETVEPGPGGDYHRIHVATFAALPTEDGEFKIGGGAVAFQAADDSSFFGFPRRMEAEFETAPVRVLPLPPAGAPAGFHGNVGSFTIESGYSPEAVKVFGEKKISLTVKGKGNLFSFNEPIIEKAEGVRVLVEKSGESIRAGRDAPEGELRYTVTLIPEKPGMVVVKEAGLSFFNPWSARYERVHAGPFRVVAIEGSPSPAVEKPGGRVDPGGMARTNPLPLALSVAGAVALLTGIALWDRRRYRTMARQGGERAAPSAPPAVAEKKTDYRRELYLALRRGDMPRFLRAAEKSLNQLSGAADKSLSGPHGDVITALKNRVELVKYGGRGFSDADAGTLHEELVKLLDEFYGGS